MGRPLLDIDEEKVHELAKLHCTYEEIAAVMGCSTDTLSRRFADYIEKGREEGKTSLRRAQFKKALEGNPTMLIWLSKQYLGQQDAPPQEAPVRGLLAIVQALPPAEVVRLNALPPDEARAELKALQEAG